MPHIFAYMGFGLEGVLPMALEADMSLPTGKC